MRLGSPGLGADRQEPTQCEDTLHQQDAQGGENEGQNSSENPDANKDENTASEQETTEKSEQ